MKRLRLILNHLLAIILPVAAFSTFPSTLSAKVVIQKYRRHYAQHYYTVSGGLGYYALTEDINEVKTFGGAATMLGFGYEMRAGHFFLDAGIDFSYGISGMRLPLFETDAMVFDTQGKTVNYHYVANKYTEVQHDVRLGIPVMVGFHTKGLYGGIGAKFSYAPNTIGVPTVRYTTTGTYLRYIEDFGSMPNHYYYDYRTRGHTQIDMLPQGSVIAEVGYDILSREHSATYSDYNILKLSLYAEYGLNSAIRGSAGNALTYRVNPENASNLIIDSYYSCKNMKKNNIMPLFVGVKVTYMIRIKTRNCFCF